MVVKWDTDSRGSWEAKLTIQGKVQKSYFKIMGFYFGLDRYYHEGLIPKSLLRCENNTLNQRF